MELNVRRSAKVDNRDIKQYIHTKENPEGSSAIYSSPTESLVKNLLPKPFYTPVQTHSLPLYIIEVISEKKCLFDRATLVDYKQT